MNDVGFWRSATLGLAAVGQTLFTVLYALLPWWNHYLGRALFFKSLILSVLLNVAFLSRGLDWTYEDATFVVMYGLMALGIWVQTIAFFKVMRKEVNGE